MERMRRFLIPSVLLIVLLAILYPVIARDLPFSVPPWVAVRAKQRAFLVKPGMTEPQVWATLGLNGWGFKAQTDGSGPRQAWPSNYVLFPGYAMHMRWNLTTKPATLVEFTFLNHL